MKHCGLLLRLFGLSIGIVLESYSLQECAILLNCTKQDIAIAQARALQHAALVDVNSIAPVMRGSERASAAHFLEPAQVA